MRKRFRQKAVVNIVIIVMIFCSVVMPSSSCVSYAEGETGDSQVTLMLTGDLMCDYKFQDALYNTKTKKFNFDNTFRFVKPLFDSADIVVGNLEGNCASGYPLSRKRHRYRGKPYLNGPYSFLTALKKAGFDGLVMSNNHNCDTFKTGLIQTVNAVNRAGFQHTGLYASEEDKHYFIIEKNGIKVAFLSYANYFNGLESSLSKANQNIMLSRYSQDKVAAEVQEARDAGADFIIVYIHMGVEYTHRAKKYQKKIMKAIAQAGADYIVGSHSHVLQGKGVVEYGGKQVHCTYGMGNFTGKLGKRSTKETAILKLTLNKNAEGQTELSSEKFIPCYMSDKSIYGKQVIIPKGTKVKGRTSKLRIHFKRALNFLKLIK